MTGPLAAVLTLVVGAAAAAFSALVVLTVLRALLRGGRPGGLGCWVLVVLLLAIWVISGLLGGGQAASGPSPARPTLISGES